MLGDRLAQANGRFTGVRVLPVEGGQSFLEVSFQGRGRLLVTEGVEQPMTDTGTYRQTFGPDGTIRGEGDVIMMTDDGDIAHWHGVGVGYSTGPGYSATFGATGTFLNATGVLRPLLLFANVLEYEVETDGAYDWEMFAWTGKKHIEIPQQRQAQQTPSMT
jgi:hypothetical protein